MVFNGMRPLLSILRPDAEIVMEITPELSGPDSVMGELARAGWNAYALMPQDSIDNYLFPVQPTYAARIVNPITSRTDVVFSRTDTDRITYATRNDLTKLGKSSSVPKAMLIFRHLLVAPREPLNYPRFSGGNDLNGEIQIDAFIPTGSLSLPVGPFR